MCIRDRQNSLVQWSVVLCISRSAQQVHVLSLIHIFKYKYFYYLSLSFSLSHTHTHTHTHTQNGRRVISYVSAGFSCKSKVIEAHVVHLFLRQLLIFSWRIPKILSGWHHTNPPRSLTMLTPPLSSGHMETTTIHIPPIQNSIHEDIQFTIKIEENGWVPFPDLLVVK